MRYIGGKFRIAKDLAQIILSKNPDIVVEPFCGALNVSVELIRQNPKVRVIASDIHDELIHMWKAVQEGWLPPDNMSEEQYYWLRSQPSSPLRTFAGYGCSFSGKWFGGYASDETGRNYCRNAKNSIEKIVPFLSRIEFRHGSYDQQVIAPDAVVYCDPPYAKTTQPGTRSKFDHEKFWKWVMSMPNVVFVSEYTSPVAFEIWRKVVKTDMQTRNIKDSRIEKLFTNKDFVNV